MYIQIFIYIYIYIHPLTHNPPKAWHWSPLPSTSQSFFSQLTPNPQTRNKGRREPPSRSSSSRASHVQTATRALRSAPRPGTAGQFELRAQDPSETSESESRVSSGLVTGTSANLRLFSGEEPLQTGDCPFYRPNKGVPSQKTRPSGKCATARQHI